MTPKEAVKYFIGEYVGRFGCDAESCTEEEKTHQAILALSLLVGLDEDECRLGYCTKPHGAQGKGEA